MLISVLMSVYNGETTLRIAMDSILAQTYKDFEFIICDDCSTDTSWNILCEYQKKDYRVHVFQNPYNLGLAASLNKCFAFANGKYIARQDADDISSPYRFENQITYLNTHPHVGVVGTNAILYNGNWMWGYRKFPEMPESRNFLFSIPFLHGTLMFRKESLAMVNGYRVSKETLRTEDYDLLMRMYARGIQGANIDLPLYWFLEDYAAAKRRKYRYRIDEAFIRYRGFCELHLFPVAIPYVIKPLVVGIIPIKVLIKLKMLLGIQEIFLTQIPESVNKFQPTCWTWQSATLR